MASFQTHLGVGSAIIGTAALAAYAEGVTNSVETQWLFIAGVSASVFADIDADDSRPVRAFFALAGLIGGFSVAAGLWDRLLIVDLILVWAAVSLCVYYPLRLIFARLTVHRGIFHSLLMASVAALTVTVAAERWASREPSFSWLLGAFVLVGYLTHLALDEIASVDLLGNRVKRSFGSALKPLSLRNWPGSLVLLFALAGLIAIAPEPGPVIQFVRSRVLDSQLLP